jgi:hypothetical protein
MTIDRSSRTPDIDELIDSRDNDVVHVTCPDQFRHLEEKDVRDNIELY